MTKRSCSASRACHSLPELCVSPPSQLQIVFEVVFIEKEGQAYEACEGAYKERNQKVEVWIPPIAMRIDISFLGL